MGNKYLSEVIEEHKEEIFGNNDLILITAGVGAGKNTWVRDWLTQKLHGYDNILFITSRKLIKEQMKKDKRFNDDFYNCFLFGNNYTIIHHGLEYFFKDKSNLNKLLSLDVKYVVIDEVHSLIADAGYTDSAYYLKLLIDYYHEHNIKVICLSATTKVVEKFFEYYTNYKHFDFSDECISVKPKSIKIINKETAFEILSKSSSTNKMIYMANSVKDICNSYYPKLINTYNMNNNSIGILISDERCKTEKSKTDNINLKNCLENMDILSKSIVENEVLPDEINILLATSKIREGINIKDNNLTAMFCESHNAIDLIQFAGRYRGNIETFYIIANSKSHYTKEQIEEYNIELDFLQSFELKNINIYAHIQAYKDNQKKNELSSTIKKNYLETMNLIPTNTIENRLDFIYHHGYKTEEDIKKYEENYKPELFEKFKNYIITKYPFLRYNIFTNEFEIYQARCLSIKEDYANYISFMQEPYFYLKKLFELDNILIDTDIKSTSQSKTEITEMLKKYLIENNLVNIELTNEEQSKILNDIYSLPYLHFPKKYKYLSKLLSAYHIKTIRVGGNNNKRRKIIL